MIFASLPFRILHEFRNALCARLKERDADFHAGLKKAGFWLDWGRRQRGPVQEIPAAGVGVLHRRGGKPAGHRRQYQADQSP